MSSPFRKIYPTAGEGVIFLDGGLSSAYPVTKIPDNETPNCLNVTFERGAVETRQGITKAHTGMISTAPFDGLCTRHDNTGAETMIAMINGSFYGYQGTTFVTIASGQSVYTAGNQFGHTEYENHIFFGNGGVIPYKYNGTDFTRHGVYPTTETMTAATDSTGVLSGDYNYKCTFVNTNLVESDVGPKTATFAAAAESVALTSIPVAPQSYGIDTRYIYRTEAGGTEYKYVGVINDNITSSFTDNVADGNLGVTAPTDNGVPPVYEFSVTLQDRIFCNDIANPNYVWYSEITNPYVFKSTNFETFGDNTQDIVKAISVRDNGILVFGVRTKTLWYMPDANPSNWVKIVLNDLYGSNSPFGQAAIGNSLIFSATEFGNFVGFGEIKGAALQPDVTFQTVQATGSKLMTGKIKDQMDLVQTGYVDKIAAITYKDNVYISVTYGAGATTNNRIYVIDFDITNLGRKQKFALAPWTGINAAQFTIFGGDLYCSTSDSTGYVYKLNDGTYNDDGAAIDSYIETKEFSGFKGDENFHKDFRYFRALLDNLGNYNIDILYSSDSSITLDDKKEINTDPGGSLWGTMIWDQDRWGGGVNSQDSKIFLGVTRGNRIKFRISNQNKADQRFRVNWIKFSYNLKGFR